ncbi:MAG: hypothetical protein H0V80_16265 [Acidobacteria bacterium]|nr:hypothetical protein [Acidobacteriota bacterium]
MFIVTIAALVMSVALGWLALRLLREEQRRSDARVAVLSAALDGSSDQPVQGFRPGLLQAPRHLNGWQASRMAVPTAAPAPGTPTVVLLDDSRDDDAFFSEKDTPPAVRGLDTASLRDEQESRVFAETPRRQSDLRGALMVGVMAALALVVFAYLWLGRSAAEAVGDVTRTASTTPSTARPAEPGTDPRPGAAATAGTSAQATAGLPLDLVTLGHEQRGGRVIVRGLVRNPVAGSARSAIVAHVALLDQAGAVVGTGQAPVDVRHLKPGVDGGFAVTLPSDPRVRRYRVTFRGDSGLLVAHQDRRATTVARRASRQ